MSGYWGMVQILADGLKLILKSLLVTLHRGTTHQRVVAYINMLWSGISFYVTAYVLYTLLYIAYEGSTALHTLLLTLCLSGIAHYYLLLAARNTSSAWMELSVVRGAWLYYCYDLPALLLWLTTQTYATE